MIGAGFILKPHALAVAAIDEAVLHAVADTSIQRAAQAARQFGFAHSFGSVEALAESDCDVVHVLVPPFLHLPIAETLIYTVKNQVDKMNERARQTKPQFEPGQPVWVVDGELAGFAAVFEKCVNGQERVSVLLEMMRGRQVRVEVPLRSIQAINPGLARAR